MLSRLTPAQIGTIYGLSTAQQWAPALAQATQRTVSTVHRWQRLGRIPPAVFEEISVELQVSARQLQEERAQMKLARDICALPTSARNRRFRDTQKRRLGRHLMIVTMTPFTDGLVFLHPGVVGAEREPMKVRHRAQRERGEIVSVKPCANWWQAQVVKLEWLEENLSDRIVRPPHVQGRTQCVVGAVSEFVSIG